jgi:hypothetical protein
VQFPHLFRQATLILKFIANQTFRQVLDNDRTGPVLLAQAKYEILKYGHGMARAFKKKYDVHLSINRFLSPAPFFREMAVHGVCAARRNMDGPPLTANDLFAA